MILSEFIKNLQLLVTHLTRHVGCELNEDLNLTAQWLRSALDENILGINEEAEEKRQHIRRVFVPAVISTLLGRTIDITPLSQGILRSCLSLCSQILALELASLTKLKTKTTISSEEMTENLVLESIIQTSSQLLNSRAPLYTSIYTASKNFNGRDTSTATLAFQRFEEESIAIAAAMSNSPLTSNNHDSTTSGCQTDSVMKNKSSNEPLDMLVLSSLLTDGSCIDYLTQQGRWVVAVVSNVDWSNDSVTVQLLESDQLETISISDASKRFNEFGSYSQNENSIVDASLIDSKDCTALVVAGDVIDLTEPTARLSTNENDGNSLNPIQLIPEPIVSPEIAFPSTSWIEKLGVGSLVDALCSYGGGILWAHAVILCVNHSDADTQYLVGYIGASEAWKPEWIYLSSRRIQPWNSLASGQRVGSNLSGIPYHDAILFSTTRHTRIPSGQSSTTNAAAVALGSREWQSVVASFVESGGLEVLQKRVLALGKRYFDVFEAENAALDAVTEAMQFDEMMVDGGDSEMEPKKDVLSSASLYQKAETAQQHAQAIAKQSWSEVPRELFALLELISSVVPFLFWSSPAVKPFLRATRAVCVALCDSADENAFRTIAPEQLSCALALAEYLSTPWCDEGAGANATGQSVSVDDEVTMATREAAENLRLTVALACLRSSILSRRLSGLRLVSEVLQRADLYDQQNTKYGLRIIPSLPPSSPDRRKPITVEFVLCHQALSSAVVCRRISTEDVLSSLSYGASAHVSLAERCGPLIASLAAHNALPTNFLTTLCAVAATEEASSALLSVVSARISTLPLATHLALLSAARALVPEAVANVHVSLLAAIGACFDAENPISKIQASVEGGDVDVNDDVKVKEIIESEALHRDSQTLVQLWKWAAAPTVSNDVRRSALAETLKLLNSFASVVRLSAARYGLQPSTLLSPEEKTVATIKSDLIATLLLTSHIVRHAVVFDAAFSVLAPTSPFIRISQIAALRMLQTASREWPFVSGLPILLSPLHSAVQEITKQNSSSTSLYSLTDSGVNSLSTIYEQNSLPQTLEKLLQMETLSQDNSDSDNDNITLLKAVLDMTFEWLTASFIGNSTTFFTDITTNVLLSGWHRLCTTTSSSEFSVLVSFADTLCPTHGESPFHSLQFDSNFQNLVRNLLSDLNTSPMDVATTSNPLWNGLLPLIKSVHFNHQALQTLRIWYEWSTTDFNLNKKVVECESIVEKENKMVAFFFDIAWNCCEDSVASIALEIGCEALSRSTSNKNITSTSRSLWLKRCLDSMSDNNISSNRHRRYVKCLRSLQISIAKESSIENPIYAHHSLVSEGHVTFILSGGPIRNVGVSNNESMMDIEPTKKTYASVVTGNNENDTVTISARANEPITSLLSRISVLVNVSLNDLRVLRQSRDLNEAATAGMLISQLPALRLGSHETLLLIEKPSAKRSHTSDNSSENSHKESSPISQIPRHHSPTSNSVDIELSMKQFIPNSEIPLSLSAISLQEKHQSKNELDIVVSEYGLTSLFDLLTTTSGNDSDLIWEALIEFPTPSNLLIEWSQLSCEHINEILIKNPLTSLKQQQEEEDDQENQKKQNTINIIQFSYHLSIISYFCQLPDNTLSYNILPNHILPIENWSLIFIQKGGYDVLLSMLSILMETFETKMISNDEMNPILPSLNILLNCLHHILRILRAFLIRYILNFILNNSQFQYIREIRELLIRIVTYDGEKRHYLKQFQQLLSDDHMNFIELVHKIEWGSSIPYNFEYLFVDFSNLACKVVGSTIRYFGLVSNTMKYEEFNHSVIESIFCDVLAISSIETTITSLQNESTLSVDIDDDTLLPNMKEPVELTLILSSIQASLSSEWRAAVMLAFARHFICLADVLPLKYWQSHRRGLLNKLLLQCPSLPEFSPASFMNSKRDSSALSLAESASLSAVLDPSGIFFETIRILLSVPVVSPASLGFTDADLKSGINALLTPLRPHLLTRPMRLSYGAETTLRLLCNILGTASPNQRRELAAAILRFTLCDVLGLISVSQGIKDGLWDSQTSLFSFVNSSAVVSSENHTDHADNEWPVAAISPIEMGENTTRTLYETAIAALGHNSLVTEALFSNLLHSHQLLLKSNVGSTSKWNHTPESNAASIYGIGLRNLGAICYMSSLLQVLLGCGPIRRYLAVGLNFDNLYCRENSESQQKSFENTMTNDMPPPNITKELLASGVSRDCVLEASNDLLFQAQRLVLQLSYTRQRAVSPTPWTWAFKDADGVKPTDVAEQQDAHEFLGRLFDRLGHAANHTSASVSMKIDPSATTSSSTSAKTSQEIDWSRPQDILGTVFSGHVADQLFVSPSPGESASDSIHRHGLREQLESFAALSIPVAGCSDLNESLRAFCAPEKIDGVSWDDPRGPLAPTTPSGNTSTSATTNSGSGLPNIIEAPKRRTIVKRQAIADLSDGLLLHLKRFDLCLDSFLRRKLHHRLSFPRRLDMRPYTRDAQPAAKAAAAAVLLATQAAAMETEYGENMNVESTLPVDDDPWKYRYALAGVVVHSGTSDSGHYIGYIRRDASAEPLCESCLVHAQPDLSFAKSLPYDNTKCVVCSAPAVTRGGCGLSTCDGGWNCSQCLSQEQWAEFNDEAVMPFSPDNLSTVAFGGEETSGSLSSSSASGNIGSNGSSRGAYLLLYRRCRPYIHLPKTLPHSALETNSTLSLSLVKQIEISNRQHALETRLLSSPYLWFLSQIVFLRIAMLSSSSSTANTPKTSSTPTMITSPKDTSFISSTNKEKIIEEFVQCSKFTLNLVARTSFVGETIRLLNLLYEMASLIDNSLSQCDEKYLEYNASMAVLSSLPYRSLLLSSLTLSPPSIANEIANFIGHIIISADENLQSLYGDPIATRLGVLTACDDTTIGNTQVSQHPNGGDSLDDDLSLALALSLADENPSKTTPQTLSSEDSQSEKWESLNDSRSPSDIKIDSTISALSSPTGRIILSLTHKQSFATYATHWRRCSAPLRLLLTIAKIPSIGKLLIEREMISTLVDLFLGTSSPLCGVVYMAKSRPHAPSSFVFVGSEERYLRAEASDSERTTRLGLPDWSILLDILIELVSKSSMNASTSLSSPVNSTSSTAVVSPVRQIPLVPLGEWCQQSLSCRSLYATLLRQDRYTSHLCRLIKLVCPANSSLSSMIIDVASDELLYVTSSNDFPLPPFHAISTLLSLSDSLQENRVRQIIGGTVSSNSPTGIINIGSRGILGALRSLSEANLRKPLLVALVSSFLHLVATYPALANALLRDKRSTAMHNWLPWMRNLLNTERQAYDTENASSPPVAIPIATNNIVGEPTPLSILPSIKNPSETFNVPYGPVAPRNISNTSAIYAFGESEADRHLSTAARAARAGNRLEELLRQYGHIVDSQASVPANIQNAPTTSPPSSATPATQTPSTITTTNAPSNMNGSMFDRFTSLFKGKSRGSGSQTNATSTTTSPVTVGAPVQGTVLSVSPSVVAENGMSDEDFAIWLSKQPS